MQEKLEKYIYLVVLETLGLPLGLLVGELENGLWDGELENGL